MSKRIFTAASPALQCHHHMRKTAPRAYLFRIDDLSQSRETPQPLHGTQHHPFSSTSKCRAAARQVKPQQNRPPQPSLAAEMSRTRAKMIKTGEVPNDMGLMPDTFIMPFGKKKPSWFGDRKARRKLAWAALKRRLEEFRMAIAFKWMLLKPRPKLQVRKLPTIAKDLHKALFANFASGDLSTVKSKMCDGMYASLSRRIAQRPQNTTYIWKLHKYLSEPKLVSYKCIAFPETINSPKTERHGLIQAVVRIHSLQSIFTVKQVPVREGGKTVMRESYIDAQGDSHPIEALTENVSMPNQKEVVENLVIQRLYKKAQPGEWMVWGMAEEMTIEKLEEMQEGVKTVKERKKAEKQGQKASAAT